MKHSNSNKDKKRRQKSNQANKFSLNVLKKCQICCATRLPNSVIQVITDIYGAGLSVFRCTYPNLLFIVTVVHPVDLQPVDSFTTIASRGKAPQERLNDYLELCSTYIEPLPIESVPTIFKEQAPGNEMFNQVLFAQLPSIVSSEENLELLSAFRAMIDARKNIVTNTHTDTHSNVDSDGFFHLGAWNKKANGMKLTNDTLAKDYLAALQSTIRQTTHTFFKVLEKVAAKIASIMEKLCPHLIEYQHWYDFYISFQWSKPLIIDARVGDHV
jgi:hypothetical protein